MVGLIIDIGCDHKLEILGFVATYCTHIVELLKLFEEFGFSYD